MTASSAKRAAYGGVFAATALIFSYLETLIPMGNLVFIPGFKLGLANVCVMLGVYYLGALDGFFIMLCKTVLTALLFGTPVSFLFSLCGGILAFLFTVFCKYTIEEKISFVGVSVGSAALHNIGQTLVAALIFKDTSVLWYLEWLMPVSVITGIITGCLALTFKKITEKRL